MLRISPAALMVLGWSVLFGCGAPATPDSGTGGGGGGEVTCPAGQTRCGATCVNLQTSNLHCGRCTAACDSTSQCVTGSCFPNDCPGANCADAQICFAGQCLQRACVGVTCPAGSDCVEGECVSESCMSFTCPAGLACVSGCCEDVQCSGVICSSGGCQFGSCMPGATGGGGGSLCGATGGGGGGAMGGGGGATGGGGGSMDAGVDAGTDAGVDAGTDAGVDAGFDAGVDAGVDAGQPPVIILSAQFDDVAIASSPNSQFVYGRITGLTATNAKSCLEFPVPLLADGGLRSPDAGICGTSPSAWLTLPADGWTYDNTTQVWRRVIAPPSTVGRYRFFARNLTTDAGSTPVSLEITGPTIIFSDAVDGPAKTDFVTSAPFHGRITGLSQTNALSCRDPNAANNCQNLANFVSPDSDGWTFDTTRSVWRQSFPVNSIASGMWHFYARNPQDQSSAEAHLTISP